MAHHEALRTLVTPSIAAAVERFARDLPPNVRVLDVGCGRRPYAGFFESAHYIGLDVSASGRQGEDKRADAFFDGTRLPIAGNAVEAAICTEVLEHAVDPVALTQEMYRVLKPDGRLLITVPFIWGLHELPYDFRRFTPIGLAALVRQAGFEILHEDRLVCGADAIRTLVHSELNNFRLNVVPRLSLTQAQQRRLRWAFRLHDILFGALVRLWNSAFILERVYLDNLLIARKA
jgi:SAM-dependent methyltransferase